MQPERAAKNVLRVPTAKGVMHVCMHGWGVGEEGKELEGGKEEERVRQE